MEPEGLLPYSNRQATVLYLHPDKPVYKRSAPQFLFFFLLEAPLWAWFNHGTPHPSQNLLRKRGNLFHITDLYIRKYLYYFYLQQCIVFKYIVDFILYFADRAS